MVPDDVAAALGLLQARRPDVRLDVRWHRSLGSTMDGAAALAGTGAARGLVVGADEQTAGRGRRGRVWVSPPGAGLYFSYVARPTVHANRSLPLLTLAAGVAVCDGIRAAVGLAPELKWPNDVLIDWRKLAGILAEGQAVGSSGQAVVIGVGLNLRPSAALHDATARVTSLEGELGRGVERALVLAEVLVALWDRLAALERRPDDILQAWRAASPSATGTPVEWQGRTGITEGIDDTGALLVRTTAGIERVIAGELTWYPGIGHRGTVGTNP